MDTRLVVVSNRLAVILEEADDGGWRVQPGSGGLVTALGPVLRGRGGIWIGWLGSSFKKPLAAEDLREILSQQSVETGYALKHVEITPAEMEGYYFGFSNQILWPLFHDLPTRCNFDPGYWDFYVSANDKFARVVVENTDAQADFIWVHDYQLMLVAHRFKVMGEKRRTGFFLHIPFPPLDNFLKLPWRFQILEGLLEFGLVGFQTIRDRRNFLDCVRTLFPKVKTVGQGSVLKVIYGGREILVGTFPISIDFKEFSSLAATREVEDEAWIIHANLPDRQLILGVDRLDYTKGIPLRLLAFADALERHPDLRRRVTLIQVVVPSRQEVPEYELLKREIDRLVGEINGRFTEVGWMPIQYVYRSLTRTDLVAYYRTCEIALITPLKDGMNLVAKEFCAGRVEDNGVVILSEFAGAAAQLRTGALLVNPFDIKGVADTIHRAFHMPHEERAARMRRMRRSVQRHNIYEWVNSFLEAGISKNLNAFPPVELYVPRPPEGASSH